MTNVDWGNNINFIFMRDQNSPPLQNNLLIGEITSTLSSWGIKIRKAGHQLRANVHVAANMFLFKKESEMSLMIYIIHIQDDCSGTIGMGTFFRSCQGEMTQSDSWLVVGW